MIRARSVIAKTEKTRALENIAGIIGRQGKTGEKDRGDGFLVPRFQTIKSFRRQGGRVPCPEVPEDRGDGFLVPLITNNEKDTKLKYDIQERAPLKVSSFCGAFSYYTSL